MDGVNYVPKPLLGGYISRVICFSRMECKFWDSLIESRSSFMYLGSPLSGTISPRYPSHDTQVEKYIFSGGRTARDFPTLFQASFQLPVRVVVVGTRTSSDSLSGSTDADGRNFVLLPEVGYERFMELLTDSVLVVIPLRKVAYPSGQSMLVDALALGKPVIVTRCSGSIDYINDGENGFLVEPGNFLELRDKINYLLSRTEEMGRIGSNARTFAVRSLSLQQMASSFSEILATTERGKAQQGHLSPTVC